jgi:uncharacterized protein (DUF433 family)
MVAMSPRAAAAKLVVLDRRLYSFAEVDDLAGLPPGTARRWLEGYVRGSRFYEPLLRAEPTGDELATWGEFVEADLVGRYRRKGVPVQQLRPVIMRLRGELGTDYPLALERPLTLGRAVVRAAQTAFGVHRRAELVIEDLRTRQLILAPTVADFVASIGYKDNAAVRLHPDGMDSPVRIDPRRAFGRPTVRAVRTERVFEAFLGGDSVESLAEMYELAAGGVQSAIRFESSRAERQYAA